MSSSESILENRRQWRLDNGITDGEYQMYLQYCDREDTLKDVMKFFVGQLRNHDNQECRAILEKFKDTPFYDIYSGYGFGWD